MWFNRNDISSLKLQVDTRLAITLECSTYQGVFNILNTILADEAVLSIKTRGALLHARGAGFNEQHILFELQYKQLNAISDEILKRIRVLGVLPIGSLGEFLKNTRLEEQPGYTADFMNLLTDHEAAIRFLCEDARKCIEECEDKATHDFLVSILGQHEKMAWALRACIEPEMTREESRGNRVQSIFEAAF